MSGTLAVDACQESHPAKAEVRILLADDHALLRRGLREFLRDFLVEDGLTPDIVPILIAKNIKILTSETTRQLRITN